MINIEDLTIGEARRIAAAFGSGPAMPATTEHPYEIGQPYLIRTVTMIDTGILVRVTAQELVLKDAAWIADTGRFSEAIAKAEFGEVEPFPDNREVIIGRGAIVDAVRINKTPRSQK